MDPNSTCDINCFFFGMYKYYSKSCSIYCKWPYTCSVSEYLHVYFQLNQRKKMDMVPKFYILPLIISLLINNFYFSDKGANALNRASTISISTNDGSVNQRLRYYEDVLTHMIANPFLGTGLGNWKNKIH